MKLFRFLFHWPGYIDSDLATDSEFTYLEEVGLKNETTHVFSFCTPARQLDLNWFQKQVALILHRPIVNIHWKLASLITAFALNKLLRQTRPLAGLLVIRVDPDLQHAFSVTSMLHQVNCNEFSKNFSFLVKIRFLNVLELIPVVPWAYEYYFSVVNLVWPGLLELSEGQVVKVGNCLTLCMCCMCALCQSRILSNAYCWMDILIIDSLLFTTWSWIPEFKFWKFVCNAILWPTVKSCRGSIARSYVFWIQKKILTVRLKTRHRHHPSVKILYTIASHTFGGLSPLE